MMADAPGGPLRDAIGALIDAGGEGPRDTAGLLILNPAWPRFYPGDPVPQWDEAEQKDVMPDPGYFDFPGDDETEAGYLNGQHGQEVTQRIRCWGRTAGDAQRLHRWLKQRLHGAALTVEGYGTVLIQFASKIGPVSDPDRTAYQVAADYAAETLEAIGA